MTMIFRSIAYGSGDYAKECALRHHVLRVPLSMSLHDEDLTAEKNHEHFGLFDESGELAACIIAVILPDRLAKLRQMAVSPDHQRQGHGQRIIRLLEGHLQRTGVHRIQLHARMTAYHFYRKTGYQPVGGEFMEVGIPHILMERTLS